MDSPEFSEAFVGSLFDEDGVPTFPRSAGKTFALLGQRWLAQGFGCFAFLDATSESRTGHFITDITVEDVADLFRPPPQLAEAASFGRCADRFTRSSFSTLVACFERFARQPLLPLFGRPLVMSQLRRRGVESFLSRFGVEGVGWLGVPDAPWALGITVVPNLRFGATGPDKWHPHHSVEHITVPEKVRLDL